MLVALIAYDYIAVYKTKHMLTLAEGVTDLNLPILFVLPTKLNYSYIRNKAKIKELKEGERETFIMGLGDTVMPTILAVSANVFVAAPGIGPVNFPALGTVLGTLVSHAALMYYVLKGKPMAGLPFLCTGAIVGFAVGCAIAGVNPLFLNTVGTTGPMLQCESFARQGRNEAAICRRRLPPCRPVYYSGV